MTKLYDLILCVLEEPELYLGRRSIQRLYAFLGGYLEGHPDADDHCLDGFDDYTASRFRLKTTHNWASIIEFFSSNDCGELELFQECFGAFIEQRQNATADLRFSQDTCEVSQLHELITTILKRPELYIGRCLIRRLYAFLNGYLYENDPVNDHCLDGFSEYLAGEFQMSKPYNWADIIVLQAGSEQEELELFQNHFLRFQAV